MSKPMERVHRAWPTWFLCAAISISLGCGDGVSTTSVSGRITYRGEPLPNANVTFHPEKGHPTSVNIDSKGVYAVDLPPGEYRVAVDLSIEVPPGWKEGDPSPPPPKIVLPPQYSQRARTVLKLAVAERGEPQTADFLLK